MTIPRGNGLAIVVACDFAAQAYIIFSLYSESATKFYRLSSPIEPALVPSNEVWERANTVSDHVSVSPNHVVTTVHQEGGTYVG